MARRSERPVGCPSELVTDERGHTGPVGGRDHRLGLGRVERERLLADHVPARGARLDRERRVRGGRRRDRDRVHARERERVGERRARVLDAEPFGTARGAIGVAADEREHVEARGAQRGHVHARAEARADDDGADRHLRHASR